MRRKLIIYPQFQFTLVAINVLTCLFCFGFIGLQQYLTFKSLKAMGDELHLIPEHPYFKFLENQADTQLSHLLIAFLVAIIVTIFFNLLVSHRLAGPWIKLKKYLGAVIKTKKMPEEDFKLRKTDYMSDMPKLIVDALHAIEKKR